jgi:CTP synthase
LSTHFIFTIGGVLSGLGKGITTASVGLLLKQKGFSVTAVKIDPYISLDAGTMRPAEHGETFVTADGGEIDQDLGNYERFLNVNLEKSNNITSGKIYQAVINNERAFKYQGRDAEMFPDVIDEIKNQIYSKSKGFDFCLVEIGGTSGDLENLPFLHAAREIGRDHPAAYIMVTYLPFLRNVGELKTKPTQHAVAALRSVGIFPDIIVTRNEIPLDAPRRETIAKRCFLDESNIIDNPDTDCVYSIALLFEKEKVADKILQKFSLKNPPTKLAPWKKFVKGLKNPSSEIRIGLVGKYFRHGSNNHRDVYISVEEAITHAAGNLGIKATIVPIRSDFQNQNIAKEMKKQNIAGLIAPQGWGSRDTEGIIEAIRFARETKLPFLGLCFGMQLACVEIARHLCHLQKANSTEIDPKTPHPIIHVMPDQKEYLNKNQYGGTIRLGAWPCLITPKSLIDHLYHYYQKFYSQKTKQKTGKTIINERHRHRYEFNSEYQSTLAQSDLIFSGTSPDGKLIEAVELPTKIHPFFLGVQFHPEYQSRPLFPHPLFLGFLEACRMGSKLVK